MLSYKNKQKDNKVKSVSQPSISYSSPLQLKDNRSQSSLKKKQIDVLVNYQPQGTLIQKKVNISGLLDPQKSGKEHFSGHSTNNVKTHYNSSQPTQLNAIGTRQDIIQCLTKEERTNHLVDTGSVKGHVMYARDEIIKTRRAGRRSTKKKVKVAEKESLAVKKRNRFFTHTEGHYVKTMSKKNLSKRVKINKNTMEHILQGRLDMCSNCREHIINELVAKYPKYKHKIHYSFSSGEWSRKFWKGKGKKIIEKIKGGHTLIRYDES